MRNLAGRLGILWLCIAATHRSLAYGFPADDVSAPDASALIEAYSLRYQRPDSARASERPFLEPESQYAGDTSLDTELRLTYVEQVIPADRTVGLMQDQRVRLRCYNGRMIGPTLRIRPGNTLSILIRNELPVDLPADDCAHPAPGEINKPHGWNCTNLHVHGLHVSPEGHSDNVFVEIRPDKSRPYKYQYAVPSDHVSGTFWYHPHKHGSVALQLTSGLAGALIVEGTGLDLIPEVRAARERVMVLQQLRFKPDPSRTVSPQPEDVYAPTKETALVPLINGQLHPVIYVAPGSVERWRFVHAGLSSPIKLAVIRDSEQALSDPKDREYLPLQEIAIDGIPRGKMIAWSRPSDPNYPVMSPGYRWDVLFPAPLEAGRYFLVDADRTAAQQLREGEPATPTSYLAKIIVDGPPRPMHLPQQAELAAAVPAQFRDVTNNEIKDKNGKPRICAIELALVAGKGFYIDKCAYNPDRIDRVAWLNTAEEWHITGVGRHPFHIHVNPFQQLIFDASGNTVIDRIWRDTLLVGATPSIVRMRFKDFCGKTVLHCHILDHEDQGMMENFLILPEKELLGNRKVRVLCTDQVVQACDDKTVSLRGKPMPRFALPSADGQVHSSDDLRGKPAAILFFRGMGCLHCARQLELATQMQAEFGRRNISVVAISSDEQPILAQAFQDTAANDRPPFPVLADGQCAAFKSFGCWDGESLHGTFLIDGNQRVFSARMGREPFMDLPLLLQEWDQALQPPAVSAAQK